MHQKQLCRSGMETSPLFVFIVVTLLNCGYVVGTSGGGGGGNKGPGWVDPIKVEQHVGASFNISCTINQTFYQSRIPAERCSVEDVHFVVAETRQRVPTRDIYRKNDTTIVYTVSNAAEQMLTYRCMCMGSAIMESRVYVGTKPQHVQNFNCLGYDFEYMTCNFTTPNNTVHTRYNLSYTSKENPSYKYPIECNHDRMPTVVCNITKEQYRQFDHDFTFNLEISNALGSEAQRIQISNYERMVPGRPGAGLVVLNKTTDSICLRWEMQRRTSYNKHGLQWQVRVVPENFTSLQRNQWRNASSGILISLCLDELPYAGYDYELEVRVRVNARDSVWSEPLLYTFQTEADRPPRPPQLTNGSFYVYSSYTQLRLYWEELKREEYNGRNFTYVISEYRKDGKLMDALADIKIESSSAVIEPWQKDAHYEFQIRSRNHVNDSIEASHMEIQAMNDSEFKSRIPKNILSVYHPDNSSYTLSWKAPDREHEVLSYTVYWCNSKRALQVECDGSIHFKKVNSSMRSFTTKPSQNQSLNMAVSADFDRFNTGMHWPICTRDITSDLARMEPTIDTATNSSLLVKWSTERVCPAILTAYNLTYCPRDSPTEADCETVMIDKDAKRYEIQGLKPYTYYKVRMLMYSKTKISKYSEDLVNRTAEAVPSKPQQLAYDAVTNTSAVLNWQPPLHSNGVIRGYMVLVNGRPHEELDSDEAQDAATTYKLNNLTAYTDYRVAVRARTLYLLYSEPSNDVNFRTNVGEPSKPQRLEIYTKNERTTLEWAAPNHAAGRLEYYEVAIMEYNSNSTLLRRHVSYILSTQNRSCFLASPKCEALHVFEYEVRAVNAEQILPALRETLYNSSAQHHHQYQHENYGSDNGQLHCKSSVALSDEESRQLREYTNSRAYRLHKSVWTKGTVKCSPDNDNFFSMMAPVIAILAGMMFITHLSFKKLRKMSNITCKLPSGLEIYPKSITSGGCIGVGGIVVTDGTQVVPFPHKTSLDWHALKDVNECHPQMMMQHDASCGNENSKLLLSAANTPGRYSSEIDEHVAEHEDANSGGSSYMRMNSGSTTETLLDTGSVNGGGGVTPNLQVDTKPFETVSDYKSTANVMTNNASAVAAAAAISNSVGGYIKPTHMLNWLHATTPAFGSDTMSMPSTGASAVGGDNHMSPPSSTTVMPAMNGYVTVQNLQQPLPTPLAQQLPKSNAIAMTITSNTVQQPLHTNLTTMLSGGGGGIVGGSGYVQAADLQKLAASSATTVATATQQLPKPTSIPTNSFGYTTMEQLAAAAVAATSPVAAVATATTTTLPMAPGTMQNSNMAVGSAAAATVHAPASTTTAQFQPQPISGYVTQRDLNAFAQQQQQQIR